MNTPVIRKAVLADAEKLSALARETFDKTFSPTNSPENMRTYMDANFFPERQRQEILDPQRHIYIAWDGDKAVGFLSMHDSHPEPCVVYLPALEISRLYVDEAWHGTGLAHRLMDKALEIGRDMKVRSLWLGVWEFNERAQKFYAKKGFRKAGSHIFHMGQDAQTDFIFEYVF